MPEVFYHNTILIGSGAAAYNCADWLFDLGVKDAAIVTEGLKMGTSRNTGSDKQTYYKLSLASSGADSVEELARTLYSGGSVDGDTALCEAANSVRSFIKLCHLGVPFPTNEYGEYVGYKTDHDTSERATSAGPLTSKYMTEVLERSVIHKGIKIYDGFYAAKLLTDKGRIRGFIAIDEAGGQDYGIKIFKADNVVLATGGPAGIYRDSVFPKSHTGSTGLAIDAGALMSNVSEWQYGLASIKFRWNVSGTYQQVLPRYISLDKDGRESEFLNDCFDSPWEALDMVFLKGYQWPFDCAKINGSSRIDSFAYNETLKGNRVYMDFTREPAVLAGGDFSKLSEESRGYLKNSGALIPLPIKRLEKMNVKAIEIYRNNGIDLYKEPLEVRVCAQHNNGGVAVDKDWQTNIKGLFCIGEAAGTFGIYRPGGSALNSGQAGGLRAAEYIALYGKDGKEEGFDVIAREAVREIKQRIDKAFADVSTVAEASEKYRAYMSTYFSHIRKTVEMERRCGVFKKALDQFGAENKIGRREEIIPLLKNYDMLLTQMVYASAMYKCAENAGSRGSAVVFGQNGIVDERKEFGQKKLVSRYAAGEVSHAFENVRPLPVRDNWFENVWNNYNERRKNLSIHDLP
jgi:succinate dehydrogenase/fumarate reductase flavoprotein subunit